MDEGSVMEFWQAFGLVAVTAVLGWIGHALVAAYQRGNEKDRALEAEKRETYKRFMTLLFEILRQSTKVIEGGGLGDDLETRFFEVARDMTVYSSDDVLDLWVKFKNMGDSAEGPYVLSLIGELMAAVRADLGHTNSRFTSKDLLSTFVNDIDSIELPQVK